jgi:cytochrome c oxidase subunit III
MGRRSPTVAVEQEPQAGGPTVTPPPGGFGGDGDDSQSPRGRGPGERLRRYRLGLGFAIFAIFLFFLALTSAYVVRHHGGPMDKLTGLTVHDWKQIPLPRILWLNTILLLMSSVTLGFARRRLFREEVALEEWFGIDTPTRQAIPLVFATVGLGTGFLVGQFIAWRQLSNAGFYASTNPGSGFFYVLTGAHGVHLIGGLVALFATMTSLILRRQIESRQIALDLSALYWHAMGVLWLYVVLLLLLFR